MIEKILKYSGLIFTTVGIICLFLEAYAMFKRKSTAKLVVAGMVCLTVSVVGFLVTDVILYDKEVPYFFTIAWIVLLWAYIVCNLVSALLVSRKKRRDAEQQIQAEENGDGSSDETAKLDEQSPSDSYKQ